MPAAAMLTANAPLGVRRAGQAKPTIAALKSLKGFEGVLGRFDADPEGNMVHSVSIGQIEDEKLHLVKKVSA